MKIVYSFIVILCCFASANAQRDFYEVLGLKAEPVDISYGTKQAVPTINQHIPLIDIQIPQKRIEPISKEEDIKSVLQLSKQIKTLAPLPKESSSILEGKKIIDIDEGGLFAYENQFCNYYKGKKNKKQFKGSYYHVEKLEGDRYKVQTKEGFSIIDEKEKVILSGTNSYIKQIPYEDKFIYSCTDIDPETNRSRNYTFLEKENVKIVPREYHYVNTVYYDDQYLIADAFIDHKNQVLYFPDAYVTYKVINKKPLLISAGEPIKKEPRYLIGIDRKLITENKFEDIEPFDEYGHAIAEKYSSVSRTNLYGIIGHDGEWILEPVYRDINKIGDKYLCFKGGKTTVFEKDLKTVRTTFDFALRTFYKDLLVRTTFSGVVRVTVHDSETLEALSEAMPYDQIGTKIYCGKKHYSVIKNKEYQLLNENFVPILDKFYDHAYTKANFPGYADLPDFIFAYDFDKKVLASTFQTCDDPLWDKKMIGPEESMVVAVNKMDTDRMLISYDNGRSFIKSRDGSLQKIDEAAGKINYLRPLNNNDLFIIGDGELKGLMNGKGELIFKPALKSISSFRDHATYTWIETVNGDKYFLHRNGDILMDGEIPNLQILTDDLSFYKDEESTTILRKDGSIVLTHPKLWIKKRGGLVYVTYPNKDKVILDRKGELVK